MLIPFPRCSGHSPDKLLSRFLAEACARLELKHLNPSDAVVDFWQSCSESIHRTETSKREKKARTFDRAYERNMPSKLEAVTATPELGEIELPSTMNPAKKLTGWRLFLTLPW